MRFPRWASATAVALAVGSSQAEPPRVVLVQPSGPEVPANLLRISIGFSAPLAGPVLPRLELRRAGGQPIEQPFLEQELWSPNGKVLTVLMHPGRVKTGLNARDEKGPILSPGDDVALTLGGRTVKRWSVGPADAIGPVAAAWKVSVVPARSKLPLVVTLDAPIDGRDADYVAIVDARDQRVAGRAQLSDGENTWTFTPDVPWRAGVYKLVARATLEDPAGNRLGSRFETSIQAPPGTPEDAVISFELGLSPGRVKRRHP